jgi:hypothetical protein
LETRNMVAERAGLDGPANGVQFRLTLAPGCGTFRKKSGCKKAEINIWPAGIFSIGRMKLVKRRRTV